MPLGFLLFSRILSVGAMIIPAGIMYFSSEAVFLFPENFININIYPSINFSRYSAGTFKFSNLGLGMRIFNKEHKSGLYGGIDIGIFSLSDIHYEPIYDSTWNSVTGYEPYGWESVSHFYINFLIGVKYIHTSGFTFDLRLGIMEGDFKIFNYHSSPPYSVFPMLPFPSWLLIGWTF